MATYILINISSTNKNSFLKLCCCAVLDLFVKCKLILAFVVGIRFDNVAVFPLYNGSGCIFEGLAEI